jgi:hypothetical protein
VAEQLPEIREEDAPPEIVALYDDIRETIGVPHLALIYRHLAALPGALPYGHRQVGASRLATADRER